jgi:hemolysin activation/secretion protein
MEVSNRQLQSVTLRSQVDYLLPHVDLRFARDTTASTFAARVGLLGGWTPTDDSDLELASSPGQTPVGVPELDLFGNARADDDFVLASLDASLAFYLEPLIDRRAWEDPGTPRSSTLAHEVALLGRGQWALGHRLLPHFQQVAGGLATVRGYSQSAVVGDNLVLGTAEYRLHLPRLFAPDSTPPQLPGGGAFRIAPPHVWGAPDWDLIVRVFTDAAYVTSSHALASEPDETLLSVGGGLELRVLRYLTLRGDVGYVVGAVSTVDGEDGDTRGHVSATLLY